MLRGRGGCYKHSFYGIASHRSVTTRPEAHQSLSVTAQLEADRSLSVKLLRGQSRAANASFVTVWSRERRLCA